MKKSNKRKREEEKDPDYEYSNDEDNSACESSNKKKYKNVKQSSKRKGEDDDSDYEDSDKKKSKNKKQSSKRKREDDDSDYEDESVKQSNKKQKIIKAGLDEYGETAATAAVKAHKYYDLKILYEKGIDLAEPNRDGETPLDIALNEYEGMNPWGQVRCRSAIFFLEYVTESEGDMPFYLQEIFSALYRFDLKIDKNTTNIKRKIKSILDEVSKIKGYIDLNIHDKQGRTIKDLAEEKNLKIVGEFEKKINSKLNNTNNFDETSENDSASDLFESEDQSGVSDNVETVVDKFTFVESSTIPDPSARDTNQPGQMPYDAITLTDNGQISKSIAKSPTKTLINNENQKELPSVTDDEDATSDDDNIIAESPTKTLVNNENQKELPSVTDNDEDATTSTEEDVELFTLGDGYIDFNDQ